jgi:pyocin large subunit-like protein
MTNLITTTWHPGSFSSSEASLQDHFDRHGAEVDAEDVEQYLRKALGFKQNLRRATRSTPQGATEGVVRYAKTGRYIDLAPDGRIISFGSNQANDER